MTSNRYAAILLFTSLLVLGCGAASTVVLPEYDGQRLTAKRMAIHTNTPTILNPDDVMDDLGSGVVEDVFLEHFYRKFSESMQKYGRIDSVIVLLSDSAMHLMAKELYLNSKEKIRVTIPPDGARLGSDSAQPDFVVLLSKYSISRGEATSGTWSVPLSGQASTYSGGSMGDLRHQLLFVIWDNTYGRLVSYGRAQSTSSILFFSMTKGNWNDCIEGLALDILKASPFFGINKARRSR